MTNPQFTAPQSHPLPGAGPAMDPGVYIDVPFFLPVYNDEVPGEFPVGTPIQNLPKLTPLPNPSSQVITFETPRSPFGDFTLQGFWAWLCAINLDPATAPANPLVWVDPDEGVISDALPGPSLAPPDFIGAQEGNLFDYNLRVDTVDVINTIHSHTNRNLVPLNGGPYRIAAGTDCKLTIFRRTNVNFFPNTLLYLSFGLFGSIRYLVPPPYKPDACAQGVRPAEFKQESFEVATDTAAGAIGSLSRNTLSSINVALQHPIDFFNLRFAGAEHMFCRLGWQTGTGALANDYVPARLFKYPISGGQLPQPIKVKGQCRVDIDAVQPIVVANQLPAAGRFALGGVSYGW